MKIIFFLENYYCGGVDTFVINLINNWPHDTDELILICNSSHSGLELIRGSLSRTCQIITHDTPIFTNFFELKGKKTKDRLKMFFLKVLSPVLRYVFLLFNIGALKKILLKASSDRLMIINGGYPGGDSCRAAAIAWGIFSKKPLSIHNFHGVVQKPGLHIALQEYIIDSLMAKYTKIFVTVSKAAAKTMSSRKNIYSKETTCYIYNGIEVTNSLKIDIKQELNIPAESKLCLMLGAYHQHKNFNKGHEFLLKVLKKVRQSIPETHLLFCGYGSSADIQRVKDQVVKYNIEGNVHISGFRENVHPLFKQIDIMLIGAQAFETFCLAAIEAMAHKVPVVATKVGAIPEVVLDGQGGYCVDKEDVDSYARHLIDLLSNSNLLREQGEKGFSRYEQFFTAVRMSGEYAELIRNN